MAAGLLTIMMFTVMFAMVANRLSKTILTAPMIFIGFGFAMAQTGILPEVAMEETLHLVAEVTLIILLFLDAAQTDFPALRKRFVWPARMLLIGLPLAVLIGTLAAWPLLPGWPIVAIALVAAILAPTDAALGQTVVTNPIVPERARRALTVESGLNDGLALPLILLFASLTAEVTDQQGTNWFLFGSQQLILGPICGAIGGIVSARILIWAKDNNHTADIYEGVGAIALAIAIYLGATAVGGNGFIAAFVGGLFFGAFVKGRCKFVYEFTESEGQGLTWAAFFLIGLLLLPEALHHLTWQTFAIILISLFVVRPLAIWISLIGTDASTSTKLFFGWFGPRGLATALFALIVVREINSELGDPILHLSVNAVWISALLHGISAIPASKYYASKCANNTAFQTQITDPQKRKAN
ncbi:MAG: cation:proton antiporter [Pseudomonadota bacterium]